MKTPKYCSNFIKAVIASASLGQFAKHEKRLFHSESGTFYPILGLKSSQNDILFFAFSQTDLITRVKISLKHRKKSPMNRVMNNNTFLNQTLYPQITLRQKLQNLRPQIQTLSSACKVSYRLADSLLTTENCQVG